MEDVQYEVGASSSTTVSAGEEPLEFVHLNDDVLCYIAGFLTVWEIRKVGGTCRRLRAISKEAIEDLDREASAGLSQLFSGHYPSIKEAVISLFRCSERQHPRAMFEIGSMYGSPFGGISRDWERGKSLIQSAAAAGCAIARVRCLEEGIGCDQDHMEAFRLLMTLDPETDPRICCMFGWFYSSGVGCTKQPALAAVYYRQAAERGFPRGQYNYGAVFYGGCGVPQDYEQAYRWFSLAAACDDSSACHGLGWCYRYGQGVESSDKQAFHWFKKGSEFRYGPALAQLSLCFRDGVGVQADEDLSRKWMKEAAMEGDAYAKRYCTQHNL